MSTLVEEGTLSAYKEKNYLREKKLKGQGFGNTFNTVISTCTAHGLLSSMMPYYTCEDLKGSSGRKRGPKKSNS